MKKIASLLLALVLLTGLVGTLPVSAAEATLSLTADKSNVKVGNTITVTAVYQGRDGTSSSGLPIATSISSLDAVFYYNSDVFEFISCTGANAAGSNGMIRLSYSSTSPLFWSCTIKLTFKAINSGNANFKIETDGVYDNDDNPMGSPSKSLSVTAAEDASEKSNDATLSSIVVRGSFGRTVPLSPQFNKNVTNYTATVDILTKSCTISYTTSDSKATATISGNNTLESSKTTRVITVTAQNGTTKKYPIVIIRSSSALNELQDSLTTTTTARDTTSTTKKTELDSKPTTTAKNQPADTTAGENPSRSTANKSSDTPTESNSAEATKPTQSSKPNSTTDVSTEEADQIETIGPTDTAMAKDEPSGLGKFITENRTLLLIITATISLAALTGAILLYLRRIHRK